MKVLKIETLWQELERDELSSGLLCKRFSADIKPDIYIALKFPEKLRCIAARLDSPIDMNIENLNSFRDIKIETIDDHQHKDKKILLILLLDSKYNDVFAPLCEDLMNQIADITSENRLINELLARLAQWQTIFEKYKSLGLSEESQIGLYGELFFLRKLLSNLNNHRFYINAWKGPDQAVQDFQYSDWAIEVKTTHGKNHQKIQITSERQLDTSIIPNIYLYHLSLDIRENKGETLNELVDNILDLIDADSVASINFKQKLLNAGYFGNHRTLYSNNGYRIRKERLFTVTETFPRIIEGQLSGGVGDVRYSIVLEDNVPWKLSAEDLFSKMRQNNA